MSAHNRTKKAVALALAVVVVGLVLCGFIALQVHLSNQRQLSARLQDDAQKEVAKVVLRLASYHQALQATRSFVLANNGRPSPAAFAQYVSFIGLDKEFPGMRGIGVIERVPKADEETFVERVRQAGLDTFNLRFFKPHSDDRYVIWLIEPVINNRRARGLDIASEERRRDVADRAYARNEAQLSAPITLVQTQDTSAHSFVLMLPVFANWAIPTSDEEKRRTHVGWVYEPLVMQEILRGANINNDLFHFAIADVTDHATQQIYACEDFAAATATETVQITIAKEIFGRQWQFIISPTQKYIHQLELDSPRAVFLDGALVTLLLGLLAAVLTINIGQRRYTQAQNARLAALIEATEDAIIEVDVDGAVVQWNRGAQKMFGYATCEAMGKNLTALIVPVAARNQAQSELHETLEQRYSGSSISQRCTAQGHLLDVMVHLAPLLGDQARVIGAATIIRDVTKLRAAEHQLKELNTSLEIRVQQRTAEVEQAREELETLVNSLPDAILVLDAQQRIIKANQKSLQRFALQGTPLLGLFLHEALPADYFATISPSIACLFQGKVNEGVYSTHQHAEAEHFQWILIPAISQGVYGGFYLVEQNISVLKNNKIKLAATLAEQAALLNSINAQFLLSITDNKGVIQRVNEPFCQFSGYSRDELIGARHNIVNSGFHPREFWTQVWRHIASGQPWRGEVCNRDKTGGLFWLDTVIAPIIGADGSIERFIALRSDITARKAAETARIQMSQLLTSVLDAASEVSIIATDTSGLITVFNSGAERLLGYSAAEMVGKQTPAILHVPEEVIARGYELSDRAGDVIAGFEVFVYLPRLEGAETRRWTYVRKDGSQVPIMLTATAMRASDGRIEGYLGIAMDISAQLASQAQVSAITEQLLQAAAVANLGIWTWTIADNLVQWNEQMYAIYQQDPALGTAGQLTYEHWAERLHPDDLAMVNRGLQAALKGEADYDLMFRVCLPDGNLRYIKAQGRVTRDKFGAALSMTGINIDITELYLHEEQLRSARDLAQEANQAKSQFLANMSHEIRTPMNAVLGMLHLLQTTELSGRQKDYSHNAISAAQSLLGLLNDVLDFSKIEAGKLQLDVHEFSLQQLLDDVQIVLTGIQGAKRPVEILFAIGRDIPPNVIADKLRLQQILINLTSNALKFTERGYVKLSFILRARDTHAIQLEVRVEDTGIGIAPEHQQKIFEGFTQAEASTTRRFGGTGLGLVICQRLLALMNSSLNLTSTTGLGSQFWFALTLPLGQRQKLYQPCVQFQRVLLVEDNPQARALYCEDLSAWAAQVYTAVSGREALELLQQQGANGFDVVVIDWDMGDWDAGEQNGLATALAMQHMLAEQMPALVFMVGNEDKETLYQQCSHAAIHPAGVISKPIIPWHWEDVLHTVKGSLLAQRPSEAQRLLAAPIAPADKLRGLRLLVVEDNELNRQVAEGLLTHLGAQVDLACSGVDAVAKLIEQKQHYDLVFMDMQMPQMDGLQATLRLREVPRLAQLPIVAMTANVSPADVQACKAAGMNDHVGKPLDIQHILTVMGRYVRLNGAAVNAVAPPAELIAVTEAWDTIVLRFGKNTKLIRRAMGQFAPELQLQIEQLRAAVDNEECETQARCFHSVKGVAATVGARKLARWCSEQEQAVKAGSAAGAVQIDQLVELGQEAVQQLGQLMEINLGPQV